MEKAHPNLRNKIVTKQGWQFYIDKDGNVHTDCGEGGFDFKKHIDHYRTHNHWLEGGIIPDSVIVKTFTPKLENK